MNMMLTLKNTSSTNTQITDNTVCKVQKFKEDIIVTGKLKVPKQKSAGMRENMRQKKDASLESFLKIIIS